VVSDCENAVLEQKAKNMIVKAVNNVFMISPFWLQKLAAKDLNEEKPRFVSSYRLPKFPKLRKSGISGTMPQPTFTSGRYSPPVLP